MAATIKGINVVIGAETTGLQKALSDVNKKSRDIASELRKVERGLKFNPKDTELLAQKQKLLGEQVAVTREKLDRLKAAQEQVNEQFKRGEISEEQYRAFQREIIETESKLKHFEKQLKETSMTAEQLGKKLQDAGKKMTDAGKNLSMKVTAPILGIGAAAVKIGMDFEQSMSKVQAMSGASASEMKDLEKAARDAGASTSKSAKDAADALGYMALAGWDTKTSMDGLMPVLRLSEAGNIDLARASSLVTDSMSAMGITTKELPHYLDIVAQTARSSNTDIDQMAEAYLGVGGTLRGLKADLGESALALGFMANAGIKGSEAGKGLNAILTNLTAPTGRAKQALEQLGFTAFDSQGNFKGLENVLFELKDKTAGMTAEQRNMYLSMIGGKEHIKSLNALMNGLDDSYDELKGSIAGADGALEDVAKTIVVGLLAAAIGPVLVVLGMITQSIGALIAVFGGLAAGPVLAVIAVVAALGAGLVALWKNNEQFREGIIGAWEKIKSIVLPLVEMLKDSLRNAAESIRPVWENLVQVFSELQPVLKVIGAVVGTVLVVALGAIIGVINGVINAIAPLISAFGGLLQFIVNVVSAIVSLFTGDFVGAFEHLKRAGEGIIRFFAGLLGSIIGFVKGLVEGVVEFFVSLYDTLVGHSIIPDLVNDIITWFMELPGKLFEIIKEMMERIISGISDRVAAVKNTVDRVKEAITKPINTAISTIKNVISSGLSWVLSRINGFQSSVSNAFSKVKSAIINPVKSAIDTIKGFFRNLKLPEIKPPKLKMPHLKVTGGFSIAPPKVPKFSVRWYDKGGIFMDPAIIGISEKRPEFVGALDDLRYIIRDEMRASQPAPAAHRAPEIHLHVGTLVADDMGLKKLEQTLRKFRKSEDQRRGGK